MLTKNFVICEAKKHVDINKNCILLQTEQFPLKHFTTLESEMINFAI